MELYYIIAVTDADRGEVMNALFREAGLPMILSMPVSYTHLTLPTRCQV